MEREDEIKRERHKGFFRTKHAETRIMQIKMVDDLKRVEEGKGARENKLKMHREK